MGAGSLDEVRDELLQELGTILVAELSPEDAQRPLHELGVDSLSLVELFIAIETRFGVKPMELSLTKEDVKTVSAMAAAICRAV